MDFPGLYDVALTTITQDRSTEALVSRLSLQAVTYEAAQRLAKQFIGRCNGASDLDRDPRAVATSSRVIAAPAPSCASARSYRSDVIIDDPAVAPDHLRVMQGEDGAIVVEAASDSTGFAIDGERRQRSLIDGDTVLRVGHTALRIRDETYAEPAAAAIAVQRPRWVELGALIVAALLINGATLWLDETSEPKLSRYVAGMVGLGAVVLLWSGLWGLVSRIFAGTARFPRHLAIAAGAFLFYTVYSILAEALAFSLSSGLIFGNIATGFLDRAGDCLLPTSPCNRANPRYDQSRRYRRSDPRRHRRAARQSLRAAEERRAAFDCPDHLPTRFPACAHQERGSILCRGQRPAREARRRPQNRRARALRGRRH